MLDRFYEKTIAFPFKIDGNGKVNTTTAQANIWADRIRSVVGTLYGERVMLQNFGTKAPSHVLDGEKNTKEHIINEISSVIYDWLPSLTIKDITVGQVELDGTMQVNVIYSMPNNTDATVSVGVVAVNGNQISTEVKL